VSHQPWRVRKAEQLCIAFANFYDVSGWIQDWSVVFSFYSALHLVEEALSRQNYSSSSHRDRNENLRDSSISGAVRADYNTLKTLSEEVRYKRGRLDQSDRDEALEAYKQVSESLNQRLDTNIDVEEYM